MTAFAFVIFATLCACVESIPIKLPRGVVKETLNQTALQKLSWTYLNNGSTINPDVCVLRPVDSAIAQLVANSLLESKLLEYHLSIVGYDVNPLIFNSSRLYKLNQWSRVASAHGQTILNLAFNYGILSLMTLNFGITTLDIQLQDVPSGCLGGLDEEAKVMAILDILIRDLNERSPVKVFEGQSSVCHQFIRQVNHEARFTDRCCYEARGSQNIDCVVDIPNKWLDLLTNFLGFLLVVVFLFGPIMMPDWVYTAAMDKVNYYVKLKEPLYKNLAVIRRHGYRKITDILCEDHHVIDLRNKKDFSQCRKIISRLPHDFIIPVKISQFDINVNYKKLLVENKVPVGMLDSVFHALFLCKMSELEAFRGCCKSHILGDENCLKKQQACCSSCMKVMRTLVCCCCTKEDIQNSKCVRRCTTRCNCRLAENLSRTKKCCLNLKWISLCNVLARIILVVFILIPFYLRLFVYYIFEHPEIVDRREAAERIGLEVGHNYRMMQYLTPTHPLYLAIYSVYFLAGILIAVINGLDRKTKAQQAVMDAFMDMNNLNMLKAFEMLIINCLWPFKTYGCYGFFIGLILWPLLLPVSFIVCTIYCLPLVFLSCRIVWYTFRGHHTFEVKKQQKPLSEKLRADKVIEKFKQRKTNPVESERYCYLSFYCSFFSNVILSLICIITLYSMMLMFAEIVTFLAEIVCFTMMGVIVNASTVLKYGTLFLLVVLYCHDCYSSVNKTYLKLNKAIFKCIKDRLGSEIKEYTELPAEKQGNRGFKAQEASEQAAYEDPDDFDTTKPFQWKINDLIMFVDKEDTPRIPKKLFEMVCQIDAAGAPGPVYISLLKATRKFIILLLFLTLVFIIVMSFGDSYQVSSTNQMLATMAGGFMPFMFKNIFKPNRPDVEADLLSFRSKLDEIIDQYVEVWPMTEFIFDIEKKPEKDENEEKDSKDDKGGKGKKKTKDEKWIKSVQRIEKVNVQDIEDKVNVMEFEAAEGTTVDILVLVDEADQDWEYAESVESDLDDPQTSEMKNGHAMCDEESMLSLKSYSMI